MLEVALFILGLLVGPFLGIGVDRLVEREGFKPELRCGKCGNSLGPRSLIPVVHWFVPCPNDPGHRNLRYPATDLLAATSFAVAGSIFGASWMLAPYLIFFALLVVMSVIDAETHLLLNVLTWPTAVGGAFLVLVLSGMNEYEQGIWPALIGGAFFGGLLFVAHMAYPPGLGLGDVKMALSLGLFLGWITISWSDAILLSVWTLMLASIIVVVVGYSLRLFKEGRPEVPMGPALAVATVVVLATPGTFVSGLNLPLA